MNINSQWSGNNTVSYEQGVEIRRPQPSTRVEENRGMEAVSEKKKIEQGKTIEEKSLSQKKEALENQVAESKDGDTLQISKSAALKLDEEMRLLTEEKDKASKEREAALLEESERKRNEQKAEMQKKVLEEDKWKREVKIKDLEVEKVKEEERTKILQESYSKEDRNTGVEEISFAGKSDSDIAKLFLKGDISKAEYDREIESRESRREAISKKEEKFSKELIHDHSESEEMVRFEKELKLALSTEDKAKVKAEDRLQALEVSKGEKIEKKEKEEKRVYH